MGKRLKAGPEPERIALTKQQSLELENGQAMIQRAMADQQLRIRQVLAAADVGDAEIVGGEIGGRDPHLMIRRQGV